MRLLHATLKFCFLAQLLAVAMPAFAADIPKGTRISLSAVAETALPNDEVVVHFRVQAEGNKPAPLREEVNAISEKIKQRLEKESEVKLTTTSRRLEPLWEYNKLARKRERIGWRMLQTGRIASTRPESVSDWLEDIEKAGARLSGLQFRISAATLHDAQDALRLQAIRSFRSQARGVARGLDAKSFRIIRLQTSGQQPVYPVRRDMAGVAMMESKSAPALSAGESKLSVTVSGEIEVPFKDFPAP
ncbi:MAG: SIMPL domain-containing protein [Mariprofundaceae bacterium]|nr:SIMPL domain-containing protein [Mariprofundaceae bacterium]